MKTPFSIALRITGTIFTILLVILSISFSISEYRFSIDFTKNFEARKNVILATSDLSSLLEKKEGKNDQPNVPFGAPGEMGDDKAFSNDEGVQKTRKQETMFGRGNHLGSPVSRNVIVYNSSGSISTYGNLRSEEVTNLSFDSIPDNTITRVIFGDEPYYFYAFTRDDGSRIFLYEPLELIESMRGNYAATALVSLIAFSVLLFLVAFRIAKDSLKPLEEAIEQSRSYNRYMAHELKTPIAVISSDLELAMKTKNPEKHIESSLDELKAMQASIDKLLFLSGKEFHLKKERISITTFSRSLQEELSKLFGREDISWEIVEKNGGVDADPAFLRLLLRNCFENVYKYSQGGIAKIVVSEEGMIIENAAKNIDPKKLASFFASSESYGGKGHGIGLSVVDRIAKLHGWKVALESEKNMFRVKIAFGSRKA